VEGEIDKATGFVMDYADLKRFVQPIVDRLDHRHLGTLLGSNADPIIHDWMVAGMPWDMYPSSENLVVWIAMQVDKLIPWSKIQLDETCTSQCTLTAKEYHGGA
jgi:6-pyruvoyltetrahydropterin/6-carboxytetrahydropterin synthase